MQTVILSEVVSTLHTNAEYWDMYMVQKYMEFDSSSSARNVKFTSFNFHVAYKSFSMSTVCEYKKPTAIFIAINPTPEGHSFLLFV